MLLRNRCDDIAASVANVCSASTIAKDNSMPLRAKIASLRIWTPIISAPERWLRQARR